LRAAAAPPSPAPLFHKKRETFLRKGVFGHKRVGGGLFLSYPDQLRALKGYQALLDSFRMVQAGQSFNAASRHEEAGLAELGLRPERDESGLLLDLSGPKLRSMFSESVTHLSRVLNRVFAAEVARQMTVTALALKRYQLSHAQYPAELTALVPEFLAAIPSDPADGQPLRY